MKRAISKLHSNYLHRKLSHRSTVLAINNFKRQSSIRAFRKLFINLLNRRRRRTKISTFENLKTKYTKYISSQNDHNSNSNGFEKLLENILTTKFRKAVEWYNGRLKSIVFGEWVRWHHAKEEKQKLYIISEQNYRIKKSVQYIRRLLNYFHDKIERRYSNTLGSNFRYLSILQFAIHKWINFLHSYNLKRIKVPTDTNHTSSKQISVSLHSQNKLKEFIKILKYRSSRRYFISSKMLTLHKESARQTIQALITSTSTSKNTRTILLHSIKHRYKYLLLIKIEQWKNWIIKKNKYNQKFLLSYYQHFILKLSFAKFSRRITSSSQSKINNKIQDEEHKKQMNRILKKIYFNIYLHHVNLLLQLQQVYQNSKNIVICTKLKHSLFRFKEWKKKKLLQFIYHSRATSFYKLQTAFRKYASFFRYWKQYKFRKKDTSRKLKHAHQIYIRNQMEKILSFFIYNQKYSIHYRNLVLTANAHSIRYQLKLAIQSLRQYHHQFYYLQISLLRSLLLWKLFRFAKAMNRWKCLVIRKKEKRDMLHQAALEHIKLLSRLSCRRWLLTVDDINQKKVISGNNYDNTRSNGNINNSVQKCALHWLQLTRRHKLARQNERILSMAFPLGERLQSVDRGGRSDEFKHTSSVDKLPTLQNAEFTEERTNHNKRFHRQHPADVQMISPLVRALPRTYIPSTSFVMEQDDEDRQYNECTISKNFNSEGEGPRSDGNDEKEVEQLLFSYPPTVNKNNISNDREYISHNILSSTQWDINTYNVSTSVSQYPDRNQLINKSLTASRVSTDLNNINIVSSNNSKVENTTMTATTSLPNSSTVTRIIDPRSRPRRGCNESYSLSSSETLCSKTEPVSGVVEKVQSITTRKPTTKEDRISLAKEILQYVDEVKNKINLFDHG